MRLAEAVGELDVDAMLDRMTHEQFQEWAAKDRIEPIGTEKICWVIAGFAATVSNQLGAESVPADFIPWAKRGKKRAVVMSPNDAAAAMNQAFGR